MKIEAKEIKFILSLELEDNEIELLNCLSTFEVGSTIVQHITKAYKAETWNNLFNKIRNLTNPMIQQMKDSHNVFTGQKVARDHDRP
jgi:hypothetical protein